MEHEDARALRMTFSLRLSIMRPSAAVSVPECHRPWAKRGSTVPPTECVSRNTCMSAVDIIPTEHAALMRQTIRHERRGQGHTCRHLKMTMMKRNHPKYSAGRPRVYSLEVARLMRVRSNGKRWNLRMWGERSEEGKLYTPSLDKRPVWGLLILHPFLIDLARILIHTLVSNFVANQIGPMNLYRRHALEHRRRTTSHKK